MSKLSRRALVGGGLAAMTVRAARAQAPAGGAPLKAVASFTILADFVRNVGADRVNVTSLVPFNGDAHVYQPTPTDGRSVAQANIVFFNGLGFEGGGFSRLMRASGYDGPVVTASDGVSERTRPAEEAEVGRFRREVVTPGQSHDPHAWQNVANIPIYVRNIARALARIDAAGAAAYQANAERYAQRMTALDAWVRSRMATVPADKRRAITTHDAFTYFAAAYGVQFIAAQGVSSESEPSASRVAQVIAQARRLNIRALFIENMTNPRYVEQIAREVGAPVGGTLYADSLSPPNGPAATYEAMVRANVETIVAGLMRN
jgi:zinc/manganese transport system substrate-binding protein